jgi:hypothetical protein
MAMLRLSLTAEVLYAEALAYGYLTEEENPDVGTLGGVVPELDAAA